LRRARHRRAAKGEALAASDPAAGHPAIAPLPTGAWKAGA
jgi:hypothetical protein